MHDSHANDHAEVQSDGFGLLSMKYPHTAHKIDRFDNTIEIDNEYLDSYDFYLYLRVRDQALQSTA